MFHLRFLTEASFHVVCQLAFFSGAVDTLDACELHIFDPVCFFLFYSSRGRLAKPFAIFPPLPKDRLFGFRCLCSNALHVPFSDEPHLLFSILEAASRIYSCTWSLVLSCFHLLSPLGPSASSRLLSVLSVYFLRLYYDAKLCILSLHCMRNPQQAKIRFVAESATLLLFFDLLCCFGFHKQIPKSLYR